MRSLPDEPFIMMGVDFLEFKNLVIDFQKRELYVKVRESEPEDRCTTSAGGTPFKNWTLALYHGTTMAQGSTILQFNKGQECTTVSGSGGGAFAKQVRLIDPIYSQDARVQEARSASSCEVRLLRKVVISPKTGRVVNTYIEADIY